MLGHNIKSVVQPELGLSLFNIAEAIEFDVQRVVPVLLIVQQRDTGYLPTDEEKIPEDPKDTIGEIESRLLSLHLNNK